MTTSSFELGPAILFVPADRPDRYRKAADRSDAVVIDLEDATSPERKASAREMVMASDLDPERTVIRVNSVGTPWFEDDVAAVLETPYRMVMLPKTEERADVERLASLRAIAVCETPLGVINAADIAGAANVIGLIAGVEDLVGAMGGTSSQWSDTTYRDVAKHARSQILLAATARGKAAIDTVYLDIADVDGQRREAEDAAASGFAAAVCIHPSQVPIIRDAFIPTPEEERWARRVLEAAAHNKGVFELDGRMVDSPVFRQAESVIRRLARKAEIK